MDGRRDPGSPVRTAYRCASCGYGVVVVLVPPACPMCGGSHWHHDYWRRFSGEDAEARYEPAEPPART